MFVLRKITYRWVLAETQLDMPHFATPCCPLARSVGSWVPQYKGFRGLLAYATDHYFLSCSACSSPVFILPLSLLVFFASTVDKPELNSSTSPTTSECEEALHTRHDP